MRTKPAADPLTLIAALEARVAALEAKLASFEAPDADAVIVGLRAIGKAIGVAPGSLRRWVRNADEAEQRKLAILLKRTSTGRWSTSHRAIAQWRQAFYTDPWTGGA